MAQLESEGLCTPGAPRHLGVVRKTKREVIEMITAWAALKARRRLITQTATDEEIAGLQDVRDF
jgi:hypothetical protein